MLALTSTTETAWYLAHRQTAPNSKLSQVAGISFTTLEVEVMD